jgi:hypothetical protein
MEKIKKSCIVPNIDDDVKKIDDLLKSLAKLFNNRVHNLSKEIEKRLNSKDIYVDALNLTDRSYNRINEKCFINEIIIRRIQPDLKISIFISIDGTFGVYRSIIHEREKDDFLALNAKSTDLRTFTAKSTDDLLGKIQKMRDFLECKS